MKAEATKGARGICPSCNSELVAKCGEVKVNHWAHKGNRNCDPWWENETDWHRSWKGCFPIDWQEVIHFSESGEKHIADVKTKNGWVLEFQHSFLNPEERRSRNAFYPKLVWVVNGLRRKTDVSQFEKAIQESTIICENPLVRRILFPDECRLLKEWHDSNVLVFFDFQKIESLKQSILWFLFPGDSTDEVYVSPFLRDKFIKFHDNNEFDDFVANVIVPIRNILAGRSRFKGPSRIYNRPKSLSGFERHMAKKRRIRRRF